MSKHCFIPSAKIILIFHLQLTYKSNRFYCNLFFPASQMVVTDLVPQKDRASALGKIMIPMSAGMIIGPTLGGFLSGYFG